MRLTSLSFRSWLAWLVATSFYAYQYILRISPSIMIQDIRLKFEIDAAQFGIFSGSYYLGYALAHIPIGILLDRIGPRLIIALSILLAVLGILPLIYSHSWPMAVLGRFLLGAGSSTAILGVFKVIRIHFPVKKFATFLGISVTIGLLGAIYAGHPVNSLKASYGWTYLLQILSLLGIALTVVVFIAMPRHKPDPKEDHSNIFRDLKYVFSTPAILWTSIFGALMVGPLEGFADIWGSSFLMSVYNLDHATAAFLPSLIFLGMCAGSPLLAFLGEATRRTQDIINFSAVGMALAFSILLWVKVPLPALYFLFFIIGILCGYQVLVIHMNSLRVSEKHAGVVTAFTNMVIMSFGYVFHYGIGTLMTFFWDGYCENGIAVYSSDAYIKGLAIIPVALVLAFIGFKSTSSKDTTT